MMPKVTKQIDGYVIESGIPISIDPRKSKDKWLRLTNAMKIGDSTILKTSGEVASFRQACKKSGFNCKSRAIRDENGKVLPDTRVWKVSN
jgi:hypothetical protein|tara:strand:- start:3319 stop:3588 length:270 start_codon:yes stop_codon:yes gene_type:complete